MHDDPHERFRRSRRRRLDLATAPTWVRALTWVGTLTAIAGLGIMALALFGDAVGPAPEHDLATGGGLVTAESPAAVGPTGEAGHAGLGIALFFAGFVLTAVAGLGRTTTRRR